MKGTRAAFVCAMGGLLGGCALVVSLDDLGPGDAGDDATPDAPKDGGADTRACDPTMPFTSVHALTELDTPAADDHATLSPDERQIWFSSARSSDAGKRDIFTATRSDRTTSFGMPTLVAELSTSDDDAHPSITGDLKTIFLARLPLFGIDSWQIYVATRSSPAAAFGTPTPVDGVNTSGVDWLPGVTSDGGTLYFTRGTTDADIYAWSYGSPSPPAAVSELNSPAVDERVAPSSDALWIYWASARTDFTKQAGLDVFVAHRATAADAFGSIAVVPEVSSSGNDSPDWLSPDFCRLYLHSDRTGNDDIFVAERAP